MKTFEELDSLNEITSEILMEFADRILDEEKENQYTIEPFYGNFIRMCCLLNSLPVKHVDKWYWNGILKLLDNKGYYSTKILFMNMYTIIYNIYSEFSDAMEI